MTTPFFMPPANLKDFDRSTIKDKLYQDWHDFIAGLMTLVDPTNGWPFTPAFFDPSHPPVTQAPAIAAPAWTGLPGTALRLNRMDVVQASRLVETPIDFGSGADPLLKNFPSYFDAQNHVFSAQYRPQDEYLEWVSVKDAEGIITEVLFTCEGPEYWQTIAEDQDLLLALYQELLPDYLKNDPNTTIKKEDLLYPRDVWLGGKLSPNQQPDGMVGGYNPYNKWNITGCIHLSQPNNNLGAEINLARLASLLYQATSDPDLICCARYGEVNRNSDPTIGSAVNALAVDGKRVSLHNPVGLYMASIDSSQFTMPNGDPIADFDQYFVPLRQSPDGQMIVRAHFKVPNGVTFNGRPVRVGDLLVDGQPIVAGGQIANAITMQLFALTLPGAPSQSPQACKGHPCPDLNHPGYILNKDISDSCPMTTHEAHEALLARKQTLALTTIPQGPFRTKYILSRGGETH